MSDRQNHNVQAIKIQETDDILQQFASVHKQIVDWCDMDALGHVNNVIYHRYAESARINYLYTLDIFTDNFLVLAQASCNYLKPVTFPDTLHIGVRPKKVGNTSIIFEYVFFSEVQQAIVATSETVLVQMNKDGTKTQSWSDKQKQKIAEFEKK